MCMDQELYRFRAIIGHQGPLLASDPDWKGSKYYVQVEWETGEITFEPLSIIAADDPVTCAAYANENDLLALGSKTSLHSWDLVTMKRLLLKPSKYLSSLREGYAAISLLIPFSKPISSIAAGEYPVGLDEDMGPEGTG